MSTPEPIVETTIQEDVDLDSFNDLLYNKEPKEEKPAETIEDSDASTEQEETQEEIEDNTDLAPENEEDIEEEEQPAPKPKTRAEIRIEQLLEKTRLAEERAKAAEAELAKSRLPKENELPKPVTPVVDSKAPHFDDKNEDGTDKYPLGQFDPQFNEDHVSYLLAKGFAEQKERLEREQQEKEAAKVREAIVDEWNDKLNPARERYPDFQEKGEDLVQAFDGIDQSYGDYLTATIMAMDYGPDVLYYLSNNLDEAKKIVSMGPQKATIALGRIEAKFLFDGDEDKTQARPKVSKAPTPPPRNRGSQAALPEVPDDTEDLDAFAAKLFKKR